MTNWKCIWAIILLIVGKSFSLTCPDGYFKENLRNFCIMDLEKQKFDWKCPYLENLPFAELLPSLSSLQKDFWLPTRYNRNLSYYQWFEKDFWYNCPFTSHDYLLYNAPTAYIVGYEPNIGNRKWKTDHVEKKSLPITKSKSIRESRLFTKTFDQKSVEKGQKHLGNGRSSHGDCIVDDTHSYYSTKFKVDDCDKEYYHFCGYRLKNTFCEAYEEVCRIYSSNSRQNNEQHIDMNNYDGDDENKVQEDINDQSGRCICNSIYKKYFFCAMYMCDNRISNVPTTSLYKNCSECDTIFQNYEEPKLILTAASDASYLEVHNHLKLKKSDVTGLRINCITEYQYLSGYGPKAYVTDFGVRPYLLKENYTTQYYRVLVESFYENPTSRLWCFGFQYPNLDLVESNEVVIKGVTVFQVYVGVSSGNSLKYQPPTKEALEYFPEDSIWMALPENIDDLIDLSYVTVHIYAHYPVDFKALYQLAKDDFSFFESIESPQFCLPKIKKFKIKKPTIKRSHQNFDQNSTETLLEQNYSTDQKSSTNHKSSTTQKFSWEAASIGQNVPSTEMCVNKHNQIVTAWCYGSFKTGTIWVEDFDQCQKENPSPTVRSLVNLLKSNESMHAKNQLLNSMLKKTFNPNPEDVYMIGRIIETFANTYETFNVETLMDTISLVMDFEVDTLFQAQIAYNATDIILSSFETILGNLGSYQSGYDLTIETDNLFIQTIDLKSRSVSGFALYGKMRTIMMIKREISLDELDKTNLDFAIRLSNELLDQILTERQYKSTVLVLAIYKRRSLFQTKYNFKDERVKAKELKLDGSKFEDFKLYGTTDKTQYKAISWILNVYVPGFTNPFYDGPIQFLVKPFRNYRRFKECAHWDYGFYDDGTAKKGLWVRDGYPEELAKFYICQFWRMGQFGLLMRVTNHSKINLTLILATILATACFVSLSVLFLKFEKCWKILGVKILMNFVVVSTLQVLCFMLADLVESYEDNLMCVVIGITFHYVILSHYAWMLILVLYHYQRVYDILMSADFLANALVRGWLLPIIPVIITFSIEQNSYSRQDFCFISDKELIISLVVPNVVVTFAILFYFGKVWKKFCKEKQLIQDGNKEKFNDNLKDTVILTMMKLLILFGWIVGVFNGYLHTIATSGLFFLTVSCQCVSSAVLFWRWSQTSNEMFNPSRTTMSFVTLSDKIVQFIKRCFHI